MIGWKTQSKKQKLACIVKMVVLIIRTITLWRLIWFDNWNEDDTTDAAWSSQL